MSTSCHSCPCPALAQGQHQAVTPQPPRDMAKQHCLGQGLPWHHPLWLGLLPVPGEEGTALLLTLKVPRLYSSEQSWGTQHGSEQSMGTGWVRLGAGQSPTDPRPQSSSHIPGTLPQGLLRPAGSARAQKGRDGHEIAHGGAGWGWRTVLRPRAWEVRQGPCA